MISLTKTATNRTFGVEIEFDSKISMNRVAELLREAGIDAQSEYYNHTTRPFWKVIYDSSIRTSGIGRHKVEVVSPILKGEDGLNQIRKVCAVLNSDTVDAKVNKSCGLHVHHDANDFQAKNFENLTNLYKYYEDELDTMVAPSRRANANHYCKSLMNLTPSHLRSDRFFKLNLAAYTRHGTVEIRHFNGTVTADKICGWVCFTQLIVERAKAARSIRKSNDPQYNLFWAAKMYRNSAIDRANGNDVEGMIEIYAGIRTWVKQRKRQLAA